MGAWDGPSLRAAEPTAFDLVKEGNRYVGEQAKDKVVQIRSEKSIGGLDPAIWYVVYRDATATFNFTQDVRAQNTGNTLAALYSVVQQLPPKLQ